MGKNTFQKQFTMTKSRLDELLVLQKQQLKFTKNGAVGSNRDIESRYVVGATTPGEVTSDTIAALEVLKNTLAEFEKQWIDPNTGSFYPVPSWLSLVFRPALRKKVIATAEFLQEAVMQIIEIYTTE
jgi:hypothetical protein